LVACYLKRIKASPARYQLFQIILVMVLIVLGIMSASIWVLYNTALNAERARLSEAAQSQARLIEAIAKFNNQENISKGPEHAFDATLTQVTDAHEKYKGFGETGEFTLAQRQYDNIVFLLRHRHYDLSAPKPIPWKSELSEPMHRALEGRSGVMIGADYRGVQVLAAYEPVAVFGAAIVAKIDMAEIREPFLKASALTFLGALIILFWGVVLLRRISQPAIEHEKTQKALGQSEARFRNLVEGSIQGVLIDHDFKILFANQAIADILRYDCPSELVNLNSLLDIFPHAERERVRTNKAARMRGD
jgi:PAS domain-containing protein